MVTRLRITKVEYWGMLILFLVLMTMVGKYFGPTLWRFGTGIYSGMREKVIFQDNFECKSSQVTVTVAGGHLCRDAVTTGGAVIPATGGAEAPAAQIDLSDKPLVTIYDTYPLHGEGMEVIFRFLDEGDLESARGFLNGEIAVDRFDPIQINGLPTWTEDPYQDSYWRFIYYSLRPTNHLLYAYRTTGDSVYLEKLLAVLNSFLDQGMYQKTAWDDPHAVAFRTMVLVNDWWKLRERGALPLETSNKILRALQVHCEYLLKDENYQAKYNHGINEAAALYLLAHNFPSLSNSPAWQATADKRVKTIATEIIDQDGALMENSPYYHFYSLEKLWEINTYAKRYDPGLSAALKPILDKMVRYGVYILQPNLEVPLLGASLKRKINDNGLEAQIAQTNPEFHYVLTQGEDGTQPKAASVHYADTGQTILRSGWGKDKEFENQTQLVFNIGDYRTKHSHYDALSFSLYGNGAALLPDAGLYTYDDGEYLDYFRGTRAHNTVVVDGKDQSAGKVAQGTFFEENGYAYQTASQTLYEGVTHERAMALLGKNLVLIVDNLSSEQVHSYQQIFHLAPGSTLTTDGLTATGALTDPDQRVAIHQLAPAGIILKSTIDQKQPLDGLCSVEYGKLVPCYSLAYASAGKTARYITLLEIGAPNPRLTYGVDADGRNVFINDGGNRYLVSLSLLAGTEGKAAVQKGTIPTEPQQTLEQFSTLDGWQYATGGGQGGTLSLVTPDFPDGTPSLDLTSPSDGGWVEINKDVNWDLSKQNLLFSMKLVNASSIASLELKLATDDWKNYVSTILLNSYAPEYSGEWLNISLGKGLNRQSPGQWTVYGQAFDWSKIRKIRFHLKAVNGQSAALLLNKIAATPAPQEGSVTIVFDDGYASIKPAVEILRANQMRANIAVISKYVSNRISGYFSVSELQDLQNEDHWVVLNHTWDHLNAVEHYYPDHLDLFENDLLRGEKFLTDNGINTDPNWFIYPNGATNGELKKIVGKYYILARTTKNQPDAFYPGDPLLVKAFGVADTTPPQEACSAIADAKTYNLNLFLTFHRIRSEKDPRGYAIEDFSKIIACIRENGLKVKTVSDLDRDFGITQTAIQFPQEQPEQLQLKVLISPVKPGNLLDQIMGWMQGKDHAQN